MNICVIGGTGHIGSFLEPQLVEYCHAVTVVARGERPVPVKPDFEKVTIVRQTYSRKDPAWAEFLASLDAEVLIDILGSGLPGVYEATKKTCRHLIACGSIWMLGPAKVVPTPPEEQNPYTRGSYGIRWKELKETKERAKHDGVAFTVVLPPNICGPGKVPLDGKGGRSIEVHKSHMK